MDDLISRESVKEILNRNTMYPLDIWKQTYQLIDILPSVQPERPRGEWISREGNGQKLPFWGRYECSVCGECAENNNFCPNCGAEMR